MKYIGQIGVISLIGLISIVFAWNEPTANPPNDNVVAPLNVGSGRQFKTGDITLNNLAATSITLGGDTRFAWPDGGFIGGPSGRLMGQGRPDVGVIDGGGECLRSGLRVSRSDRIVSWGEAAAACPANWWVCTKAERGTGACKIAGWGDTSSGALRGVDCDTTEDSGSVQDSDGGYDEMSTFSGWVSDASVGTGGNRRNGVVVRADTGVAGNATNCSLLPVWCCANQ